MIANFDHLHVRVNVTWPSTILELSETSAVVRVPRAPATDRQTTVVIKNEDVRASTYPGASCARAADPGPGVTRQEHHIVVEFFGLSAAAKVSLQHIIADSAESDTRSHPAA